MFVRLAVNASVLESPAEPGDGPVGDDSCIKLAGIGGHEFAMASIDDEYVVNSIRFPNFIDTSVFGVSVLLRPLRNAALFSIRVHVSGNLLSCFVGMGYTAGTPSWFSDRIAARRDRRWN